MFSAYFERKRKLFSGDDLLFKSDAEECYEFKPCSGLKLYKNDLEIFSETGSDQFYFKKTKSPIVELSKDLIVINVSRVGDIRLQYVKEKGWGLKYQVMHNTDVIAELSYTFNLVPYIEKYKLTVLSDNKDSFDMLMFIFFAWISHECTCTF